MRCILLAAFQIGVVPFVAFSSPSADWPDVGGRYSLSQRDVGQIIACVLQRSDVQKPISKIEVWHPDQAEVHTGEGEGGSFVRLVRKHGKWSVVSVVQET